VSRFPFPVSSSPFPVPHWPLMSRVSARRGSRRRTARRPVGAHTVGQPGRPRSSRIAEPEQLNGPRARTAIRMGPVMHTDQPSDPPIVIGIDVSKAELVIAVQPTGERWTSATTPAALDAVVTRLQAAHPTLIVLEASGGYEAPL